MVLDLRSRVDSPENLNDNNANSDSIIIIDSANYLVGNFGNLLVEGQKTQSSR